MSCIEYAKQYVLTERTNFLFSTESTMVYDYCKFDSYWDALIDAIKQGEDIDDMVSLVFPERIDQQIVKEKLLKELI